MFEKIFPDKPNVDDHVFPFKWAMVWMVFLVLLSGLFMAARAEEQLIQAWVLCQPDSWINIRGSASNHGTYEGMLTSGDSIWTDGLSQNGYIHCDNMTTEAGCGWVYEGYVVYSEPIQINGYCSVKSNGRVACRRTIEGTRRKWLKNGDRLYVYSISDQWALTDAGFIRNDFLDLLNVQAEARRKGI